MKKLLIIIGLITMVMGPASAQKAAEFREISGKVIDAESKKPLPQSNVYIKNADIGTVANNAGEFLLKIPQSLSKGTIVVSSIGYMAFEKSINELADGELEVSLKPVSVLLNEVVINDPNAILRLAMERKRENYPNDFQALTTFYREIIKKNRSFIDVSQGILHVSKASYGDQTGDQLSIVKGSRVQQYKKDDTLAFKIMGGPNTMLLLDIVKHPGIVLNPETFEFYNYTLEGMELIDGKQNYTIRFEPNAEYTTPLYSGLIYVDVNSYAISGLSFGYDQRNIRKATDQLVRKKPIFAKLTPLKVQYDVKYRETNGVWYLDYVRDEIEMRCNWKKKLFNSTFNSVSEMVVTQKGAFDSQTAINRKNTTKISDIFSEKVGMYKDPGFWEHYSIIKPEDDLRKALAKIEEKNL